MDPYLFALARIPGSKKAYGLFRPLSPHSRNFNTLEVGTGIA